MSIEKISIAKMSHDEWIEERKKGIGGSDAAGIVGLNAYTTPYSIWADKTGRIPPKEDNEAMRQGRDLEDYVAKRWEETTGKKVRRCNYILRNTKYPFAHANIDRDVVGENAGLECKTTSLMNLKKFKNGSYPENYYVQCMHYMAVTGADRWYLAVLVLNKGFYDFVIERDEDEIKALMEAEAEFWTHVENDTPPAFTGLDPDSEALKVVYREGNDNAEAVQLVGRESDIENLLALKAQKKELDKSIKYYEQVLQGDLKNNEYGVCGNYSVTWKTQTRAAHMVKASTFRKFEVKKLNKEA
jgi:putative phage-type endonuclease